MEEELRQTLTNRMRKLRKSRQCADELELAAYVDGACDSKQRQALETHLADCKFCLTQVSFLMSASDWSASGDVPGWLLTKAKNLVSDRQKRAIVIGWRWPTATFAAVAVIAFLTVLVVRLRDTRSPSINQTRSVAQQQSSPIVTNTENTPHDSNAVAMASPRPRERAPAQKDNSAEPEVRSSVGSSTAPTILFPRDGAVMKRGSLEFRWREIPDVVFYELSIVTASGETVMSRQTEATFLKLPADVQLQPDTRYFISVRAHLRDGKTMRSGVIGFQISQ